MTELSAIITLSATGDTIADIREFVAECDKLSVPDETELIDGPPPIENPEAGLDSWVGGDPDVKAQTLGSVKRWLANAATLGVSDDRAIPYVRFLCVDLPVFEVELAECGDHVPDKNLRVPFAIFVTTDKACQSHMSLDAKKEK
jgi:hypothetical protein